MLIRKMTRCLYFLILLPLLVISSNMTNAQPVWKEHLIGYNQYRVGEGPWVNHQDLVEQFHKDYPDDLPVIFSTTEEPIRDEIMWVSIMDYDEGSQTYIGKLLNSPNFLTNVRQHDNIIFRFDTDAGMARAVDEDQIYWTAAVPNYILTVEYSKLYQGLREYRLGNFGHNMPEIENCIDTLRELTRSNSGLNDNDAFIAHFTLGRCAAEAYETELAIQSFKSALTYLPYDVDANMALLAEYSIAVYDPDILPKEEWENAFNNQHLFLRENFSNNEDVLNLLDRLFDKTELSSDTELTAEELEYRQKYGFGIFRWKAK